MNISSTSPKNEISGDTSKPATKRRSRIDRIAKCLVAATFGAMLGTYVMAMNTAPHIVPPPRPALTGQNGFPLLKAAAATTLHDDEVNYAIERKPRKKWTLDEKRQLVMDNRIPLERMRQALRYPYAEDITVTNLNDDLPHYAHFRQMARLLLLAGNVAWEDGQEKAATDYYLDGVTMGRKIPHHRGIMGSLVGIAVEHIDRRPIWDHLDQMGEETALYTLMRLEELEHERLPYSEALEAEKYILLTGIAKAMEHPDKIGEYFGTQENESEELSLYARFVPRKYVVDIAGAHMDKLITQSHKTYISDHEEIALPKDRFNQLLMPIMKTARCKYFANEAGDALLRTALALRAYRLRYGRYPNRLDDLVEAKMIKHLPEDPFAARDTSLRYKAQANDKYLLYSIGPDSVDDGGKGIINNDNPFHRFVETDSKGDIVAGWYSY